MASRRMISNHIVGSAKFLKMPAETQALYFHLCTNADDDWIVEAFTVMRLMWASEDNIKLLHAKWFVKILNDDLVTYILDWNEHNSLRADRKVDSIYQWLLIQIIPEVELVKAKERSDVKKRKSLKSLWLANNSSGQTMDGPLVDLVEDSIGKDSIVDYKLVDVNLVDSWKIKKTKIKEVNKNIIEEYNDIVYTFSDQEKKIIELYESEFEKQTDKFYSHKLKLLSEQLMNIWMFEYWPSVATIIWKDDNWFPIYKSESKKIPNLTLAIEKSIAIISQKDKYKVKDFWSTLNNRVKPKIQR